MWKCFPKVVAEMAVEAMVMDHRRRMMNGFTNPFPLYWYSQHIEATNTKRPPFSAGLPRCQRSDVRIVSISPAHITSSNPASTASQEELFCSVREERRLPVLYSRQSRLTRMARNYCRWKADQEEQAAAAAVAAAAIEEEEEEEVLEEEYPVWVIHTNIAWSRRQARLGNIEPDFRNARVVITSGAEVGPGRVCAMAMPHHAIDEERRAPDSIQSVLEGPIFFVIGDEEDGLFQRMMQENVPPDSTPAVKRASQTYADVRGYWLEYFGFSSAEWY